MFRLPTDRTLALTILGVFCAAMIYVALRANGTGDDGDGIQHYLFARHAFQHPENFLNHWAKPLFVMLSAPFAQLGFTGFKIFNTLLMAAAMWLGFVMAQRLGVRNAWLVILFPALSPMNLTHVQTGLTEPMFALWLMVGLLGLIPTLGIKKDTNSAPQPSTLFSTIWLSFLPFIRSEGLVVLCVLGVWLLLQRQWKYLPLMMVGHVVMGIIGWAHYGTPMWVFTKIPYASLNNDIYGAGPWLHYIVKMPHLLGNWMTNIWYIGMVIGLGRLILYWLKPTTYPFLRHELWLVYGMATAMVVAHSMFWALGIFNSYGLFRVFLGILPLFAIIMTQGVNVIADFLRSRVHRWAAVAFVALAAIGGMVHLWQTTGWGTYVAYGDMKDQMGLGEKYAERYKGYTFYFDAMVPALAFDVDLYDPRQYRKTKELLTGNPIPPKSVVVWDFRYSGWEAQVALDTLLNSGRFSTIECIEGEFNGKLIRKTCLLEYMPPGGGNPNELYTNDLEKLPTADSDTERAVSGKKSVRLERSHAFSPVWTAYLPSLAETSNTKLRYTFKAWVAQFPTEGWKAAKVVMETTVNGKQVDWVGTSVQPLMSAAGQWVEVVVHYPLPKHREPDSQISLYLWNENDEPIWIDDIKIELVP